MQREVKENGDVHWRDDEGRLHREDGPAVEAADGTQEWWVHGLLHRGQGEPAIARADGSLEWWRDGVRHRDEGLPAVLRASGSRQWWVNGTMWRPDGLPVAEVVGGHDRVDGPRVGIPAAKARPADGESTQVLVARAQELAAQLTATLGELERRVNRPHG